MRKLSFIKQKNLNRFDREKRDARNVCLQTFLAAATQAIAREQDRQKMSAKRLILIRAEAKRAFSALKDRGSPKNRKLVRL